MPPWQGADPAALAFVDSDGQELLQLPLLLVEDPHRRIAGPRYLARDVENLVEHVRQVQLGDQ